MPSLHVVPVVVLPGWARHLAGAGFSGLYLVLLPIICFSFLCCWLLPCCTESQSKTMVSRFRLCFSGFTLERFSLKFFKIFFLMAKNCLKCLINISLSLPPLKDTEIYEYEKWNLLLCPFTILTLLPSPPYYKGALNVTGNWLFTKNTCHFLHYYLPFFICFLHCCTLSEKKVFGCWNSERMHLIFKLVVPPKSSFLSKCSSVIQTHVWRIL